VVILAILTGCDPVDPTPPPRLPAGPTPEPGYIAFVAAGPEDPFWPALKASAQGYAALRPNLDVRFAVPDGSRPEDQLHLLKSLSDGKMRGLCIHVTDPEFLRPVMTDLHAQGVRLVSMIRQGPEPVTMAHAGFDEEAVGRLLAQMTVQIIGAEGSVMLLHAGNARSDYLQRRMGFEQEIVHHPGIDLLASIDCEADPAQARRIVGERSKRFPRLSAWVALEPWPIRGGLPPESAFPPGLGLITFGGWPEHWPLVRNGVIRGLVAPDLSQLGAKALEFCWVAIRQPAPLQSRYAAPLRQVNSRSLEEYRQDWLKWVRTD
jgi:ABC-type sugar transport system substrate-binding protein